MMSKEAMKLALGKIKSARDCHFAAIDTLLFEAEEILEAALAEQPAPVQQDIPDLIAGALGVSRGTAYDLMREALSLQPAQQEPVAWLHKVTKLMVHADEIAKTSRNEERINSGEFQPLYTSPPAQRKPLTDEQIRAASLQAGMQEHYMDFHSGFIRFARAIEAKLKEKNT